MKKLYFLKTLIVVIILLTVSCKKSESEIANKSADTATMAENKSTKDNLLDDKREVVSVGEIFVIAINSGDSIGAANCYTKDAIIMRPNKLPIVGRDNIRKAFSKRLAYGPLRFSMHNVAVWGDENVMLAEEKWILSDSKTGEIIDEGKSLEAYKKEDGKWKIHRDCFNSDLPCPK